MKHFKLTLLLIVFISTQACSKKTNNENFVEDDQQLTRLTNNLAHDMRPEFSPDGNTIGFISNRGGGQGYGWYGFTIWEMSATGEAETKIETGLEIIHQMSWSPDGNTIVFYAGQNEPNWDIYKVSSNGGQITNLTNNGASNMSPRFSPDGSQIVFASNVSGNLDVWTMDTNGGSLTQITQDIGSDLFPCFSPDGQKIAFTSNRTGSFKIYVLDLNTQSLVRLTDDSGNE